MLEALQIAHEEIRAPLRRAARAPEGGRQGEVGRRADRGRREAPGEDREGRRQGPGRGHREQAKLARRDKVAAVRQAAAGRRSSAATPTRRRSPTSAARSTPSRRRSSAAASRSTRQRPDGRKADEIRPISLRGAACCRASHGSGLFTRGETQVLIEPRARHHQGGAAHRRPRRSRPRKRFIHHYNFPPFSVGETGFMRGPKRRDIGHGALAERALLPMIPADGRVPLHAAARLRDARVERLVLDGVGLRLAPSRCWTPACRSRARWRASRWASSRRVTSYIILPTSRATRTTSATWTSRSPARRRASPPSRWTSRSPASRFDILRDALAQAKEGREHILGIMAEMIAGPAQRAARRGRRGSRRSRSTRSGSAPSSARAARRSAASRPTTRSRSRSRTTAPSRSTAWRARRPTRPIEQISAMTKDVEVGDTYLGAKVVKTTTFGAFVELTKGVTACCTSPTSAAAAWTRWRTSSTAATWWT